MRHGLTNLFRHRVLIQSLVMRELKARYRGSVGGYLWSFFNPLLLLAVYTIVFTTIFTPPTSRMYWMPSSNGTAGKSTQTPRWAGWRPC